MAGTSSSAVTGTGSMQEMLQLMKKYADAWQEVPWQPLRSVVRAAFGVVAAIEIADRAPNPSKELKQVRATLVQFYKEEPTEGAQDEAGGGAGGARGRGRSRRGRG